MTRLKSFIAILLKFIWSSLGQNKDIEFVCTSCQAREKIPKHAVDDMELGDVQGDLRYPPRFTCESCPDGLMYPIHYKSLGGKTYQYNPKTGEFNPKLPS